MPFASLSYYDKEGVGKRGYALIEEGGGAVWGLHWGWDARE